MEDKGNTWMPKIFASAARPSRSHKHPVHHDPHQHHGIGKHRKARVNYRQLELLHLRRKKEHDRKKQKSASEILKVPLSKRKLLCKYRKSCYSTGVIPETWDIYNILPFSPSFLKTQRRSEKMSTIDLANIIEESDAQEEVKESEIQLLCRYRKSCYKEVGAEIERRDANIRVVRVLSAKKPIIALPPNRKKTIAEIAKIALKKIEEQEKLAAQRPIPAKVIVDKKLNQIEEEMKKRLACHYRKSCYETGNPPEISREFVNAFSKIYHFMLRSLKMPSKLDLIDKTFKELEEDQKKLYCKYRKSCYATGEKPVIQKQHIFTYVHLVQKHEQLVPLELRCKYRKSCYETGMLPNLTKQIEEKKEEKVPVAKIETIYDLKLNCKYRKSCYREKAQESANDTRTVAEHEMYEEIVAQIEHNEKERQREKEAVTTPAVSTAPSPKPVIEQATDEEAKPKKKRLSKKKETTEGGKKKKEKQVSKIKTLEEGTTVTTEEAQQLKRKKIKTMHTEMKRNALKATKKEGPVLAEQDGLYLAEEQFEKKFKKAKKATLVDIEGKSKKVKSKARKEEESEEKPQKIRKTGTGIPAKQELEKRAKDDSTAKMLIPSLSRKSKIVKEKNISDMKSVGMTEKEKNETGKKLKVQQMLATKVLPSMQVERLRPVLVNITEREEMHPRKVNIADENLTPAQIKLICKYRKSCYEKGELPIILQAQTIMHLVEKDKEHKPLQLRCKYRKSCYETGILPTNLHEQQSSQVIVKRTYRSKQLRCKYRKSCYETGEVPHIEKSMIGFSMIKNLLKMYEEEKEYVKREMTLEEKKLRCKYRKSCYESGILPPILNQTVETIASTIKDQYASPQLKCKYRISCYANLQLDIALDKQRKKEERKPKEGITESRIPVDGKVKEKETKKEKRDSGKEEEIRGKVRRKKERPGKQDEADLEYMQIQLLETGKRKLTNPQKLKCKYRLSCYDGKPLHVIIKEEKIEKERAVNIKDFRRANGAICSIYYISCRKMAGLPVKERAPIGPNGRRLCRKKKKEETHK